MQYGSNELCPLTTDRAPIAAGGYPNYKKDLLLPADKLLMTPEKELEVDSNERNDSIN